MQSLAEVKLFWFTKGFEGSWTIYPKLLYVIISGDSGRVIVLRMAMEGKIILFLWFVWCRGILELLFVGNVVSVVE